uniref:Uncharacterized protein n=1 Tax=Sphaerodactylus townsendi TaxID=933632 RepID=A0ACB8GEE8_9SAUR
MMLEVSVMIKKRQQDIVRFLEANKIDFEEVDITMSEEQRRWMYKHIPQDKQPAQGNPLPPQIFSDDQYCGVSEKELLTLFLPPPGADMGVSEAPTHSLPISSITTSVAIPKCSQQFITVRKEGGNYDGVEQLREELLLTHSSPLPQSQQSAAQVEVGKGG